MVSNTNKKSRRKSNFRTSLLQPKMTQVNVTHCYPPLYRANTMDPCCLETFILNIKWAAAGTVNQNTTTNTTNITTTSPLRPPYGAAGDGSWDDSRFNPQCGQNAIAGSSPCNTVNIVLRYPWARYSAGHSFTAVPWFHPHLAGDRKNHKISLTFVVFLVELIKKKNLCSDLLYFILVEKM